MVIVEQDSGQRVYAAASLQENRWLLQPEKHFRATVAS